MLLFQSTDYRLVQTPSIATKLTTAEKNHKKTNHKTNIINIHLFIINIHFILMKKQKTLQSNLNLST